MGEQIIVSSVLEAVLWFKMLMLAAERYDRSTDIRLETNYNVQSFDFFIESTFRDGERR